MYTHPMPKRYLRMSAAEGQWSVICFSVCASSTRVQCHFVMLTPVYVGIELHRPARIIIFIDIRSGGGHDPVQTAIIAYLLDGIMRIELYSWQAVIQHAVRS